MMMMMMMIDWEVTMFHQAMVPYAVQCRSINTHDVIFNEDASGTVAVCLVSFTSSC